MVELVAKYPMGQCLTHLFVVRSANVPGEQLEIKVEPDGVLYLQICPLSSANVPSEQSYTHLPNPD